MLGLDWRWSAGRGGQSPLATLLLAAVLVAGGCSESESGGGGDAAADGSGTNGGSSAGSAGSSTGKADGGACDLATCEQSMGGMGCCDADGVCGVDLGMGCNELGGFGTLCGANLCTGNNDGSACCLPDDVCGVDPGKGCEEIDRSCGTATCEGLFTCCADEKSNACGVSNTDGSCALPEGVDPTCPPPLVGQPCCAGGSCGGITPILGCIAMGNDPCGDAGVGGDGSAGDPDAGTTDAGDASTPVDGSVGDEGHDA